MKLNREALRGSGAILIAALQEVVAGVRPGVTTKELDSIAESAIRSGGGVPAFLGHQGFPGSLCTSVNEEIVHGIPGERALQKGDVISLDLGVKLEGWYTDAAVTVPVGRISAQAEQLLAATRQSLEVALAMATVGKTTGDLGAAVQQFIEGHGLGVIRDCVGHGIGTKLHQDPSVPNFGRPGGGDPFELDTAVAIEPMVVTGSPEVSVADDHWTISSRDRGLAAHFEETVIITAGQPERVTPLDQVLPGVNTPDRLDKVT